MAKDMRKIVKEGYEKGDYAGTFRTSNKPNKMEESFLKKTPKIIAEKSPRS